MSITLEDYFELAPRYHAEFVGKNIVEKLPISERSDAAERVNKIAADYMGLDSDALTILAYAAERGRFNEFAEKLENHYRENLSFVHPKARRAREVPGAIRAAEFFLSCYDALGIHPRK